MRVSNGGKIGERGRFIAWLNKRRRANCPTADDAYPPIEGVRKVIGATAAALPLGGQPLTSSSRSKSTAVMPWIRFIGAGRRVEQGRLLKGFCSVVPPLQHADDAPLFCVIDTAVSLNVTRDFDALFSERLTEQRMASASPLKVDAGV